jgi:hypothetical protein
VARCAVVRIADKRVVNVVEYDGGPGWAPPANHEVVPSDTANIGETWTGSAFTPAPAAAPDPLAADKQRLFDYMPVSGSPVAQAVSAYIVDNTKPPEVRATMAALRALIRVVRSIE